MEQVVGEYQSLSSAQRAVRDVERCGISIQNVYISDEQTRIGRKLHAPWQRRAPFLKRLGAALKGMAAGPYRYLDAGKRTQPFLVVLRGTAEQIRNMRRLLTH